MIRRLAVDGRLRCAACGHASWRPDSDDLTCVACETAVPTYNRVADMHGLAPDHTAADPSRALALARPVAEALDLPRDEASIAAVAEVLGRASMTAHDADLDAEIRDIADRFGIVEGTEPPVESAAPTRPPEPLGLVVERHYLPDAFEAGTKVTCNVRFRNRGAVALTSTSDPPLLIGYRWLDARGALVPAGEHRTRIPIVVSPGRAITLPVEVEVPCTVGRHTLVVCPVIECERWAPECGAAKSVEIRREVSRDHRFDLRREVEGLTYAEDHEVALKQLGTEAASLLASPGRRILEIGGGASPLVAWLGPHDAVNVDISLPLLELGSRWYAHHRPGAEDERIAFMCADATHLPFEGDSFDVVALFATLHHFPKPEGLLSECRRTLTRDGLVAVLCEPVNDTLETDETLRDLDKGVNEQVFTIPEYVRIFAAAGLEPIAGNLAGGSLRAFLRRTDPSGECFDDVRPAPEVLGTPSQRPRRLARAMGRVSATVRARTR